MYVTLVLFPCSPFLNLSCLAFYLPCGFLLYFSSRIGELQLVRSLREAGAGARWLPVLGGLGCSVE